MSTKVPKVKRSKPWARYGYSARGIIYLLVGGISAYAAFTGGGDANNSKGVIANLKGQPFGTILLIALAIGLACYCLWRFRQAVFDTDRHGHSPKGLLIRAGLGASSASHMGLCAYCISLILGTGGGQRGNTAKDVTAWLMGQPYGIYIVGGVAVLIGIVGVAQISKGLSGRFKDHMNIPRALAKLAVPICGFGLTARGFVFLIIAGLFLYAAITVDPDKAGGLADALRWLQARPFGQAIFGVTSLGLSAFGIYSFMEAAWRKLEQ